MKHWTLAALAAALSSSAFAQTTMHGHGTTANSQETPVTAVPKYESAFDRYRGHSEEKLRPWRDSNDEAAAIGGHVGQYRGKPADEDSGNAPRGAMPMSPGMTHQHGMGGKQ